MADIVVHCFQCALVVSTGPPLHPVKNRMAIKVNLTEKAMAELKSLKQGKKVFKSYCLPMLSLLWKCHTWFQGHCRNCLFVFVSARTDKMQQKGKLLLRRTRRAVLSCQLPPLGAEGSKKCRSANLECHNIGNE